MAGVSRPGRARLRAFRALMGRLAAPIAGLVLGVGAMGASVPSWDSHVPALLSDSDLAAIKTGLIAQWPKSGAPEFAKIIASQNPEGAITVCGFERAKVISGGNSGMQPFIGVLTRTPWHFYPTASSNRGVMAPTVLALCREHGLQLIPE